MPTKQENRTGPCPRSSTIRHRSAQEVRIGVVRTAVGPRRSLTGFATYWPAGTTTAATRTSGLLPRRDPTEQRPRPVDTPRHRDTRQAGHRPLERRAEAGKIVKDTLNGRRRRIGRSYAQFTICTPGNVSAQRASSLDPRPGELANGSRHGGHVAGFLALGQGRREMVPTKPPARFLLCRVSSR